MSEAKGKDDTFASENRYWIMNTKPLFNNYIVRLAVSDALLIAALCLLLMLAHTVTFPFHIFEPMRLAVLVGLLWGASRKNALLLAVAVPFCTLFVSGLPAFPKCLLISVELLANMFFFIWSSGRMRSVFLSMLLSILLSKAVYYMLKWILISTLFPAQPLIGTGFGVQLAVAVGTSLCFALLSSGRERP